MTERPFFWTTFDINSLLPAGWAKSIHEIAAKHRINRLLLPKHSTCREDNPKGVRVANVGGNTLKQEAPWLYELYYTLFTDLATIAANRAATPAADTEHAAVLNIQCGTGMRYEAHVDTNPVEGLLYVTTHLPGEGGELVVGNKPNGRSLAEIDQDCMRIYPVSGNLVFFDGRRFPHYVTPLIREEACRIVVAMNFYTSDSPESMRPADLSRHLKGYSQPE